MTDFASLAIEIDSRSVEAGTADLDKLTPAAQRAEKAVDRLGDASSQSGTQLKGAGKAASDYAAAAQRAANEATGMGNSSRLASHQVQNLAFQANDLFVGLASGQKPMTVFMQQGTQIAQIMGQAGIGVGGLAKEVGGMVGRFASAHPVLTAFAVATAAAGSAAAIFTAELNASKRAELDAYANSLGLTKKEMAELGQISIGVTDVIKGFGMTVEEYVGVKASDVLARFKGVASDVFGAIGQYSMTVTAAIYAGFVGTYNGVASLWSNLPGVLGDAATMAANVVVRSLNYLLQRGTDYVNSWISMINAVMSVIPGGMQIGRMNAPQITEFGNPFKGAAAKAGRDVAGAYASAFGEAMAGQRGFFARVGENALQSAKDGFRSAAEEKGFLDDKAAKKGAAKAGKKAGEEFGKAFWEGVNKSLGEVGLSVQDIVKGIGSDISAANDNMEASWNRTAEEVKAGLDAQAEATAKWNDELRGVIDSLDQLGGFGKTLGDIGAVIYGLRTGDYSGVGGAAGYLLKTVSDIRVGRNEDGSIRRVGDVFSDALDKVFGKDGSFTKLFQGAGTGVAIGSMLFGQDNKGAQIGGAIGGGIGMAIGGPIGSIVGSLLGSVIGGIFKKTKYGTASIVNGQVTTGGNNTELKSNAGTAASGLNSVLEDIATRLGGSLGNYSVSIGQMDGKWRVSTTGRTGKLENKYKDVTDFGKEGAQQAMMAAIADAIRDGAIAGIRASTQNLLKSGGDVERQLAKALKFQNVFDELKAATDPAGFALEQITRQFDELRKIFAEAGASAEEYAQLEELLAIKRKDAAKDARAAIVDKVRDPLEMQITILQLLGKQEEALAASRLMELAGLEDTLQPLQSMIYQLQDARAVIDTFAPLADDLRKYRDELLGGNGSQSFGQITAQFRATALAAANGDAEALAGLRGVSGSYLDAAKANAGSSLEYRRALADVLTNVDKGIFAAESKVDYAQLQIDATVNVANLLADMKTELVTLQSQVADTSAQTLRLWQRFEGDGLTVKTTADEPLQVKIAA